MKCARVHVQNDRHLAIEIGVKRVPEIVLLDEGDIVIYSEVSGWREREEKKRFSVLYSLSH